MKAGEEIKNFFAGFSFFGRAGPEDNCLRSPKFFVFNYSS